MLYIKTHSIIPFLLPSFDWSFPERKNEIFLTFDDGPIPGLTDHVLDILDEYQAKATFFMVGNNVKKFPETARQVYHRGHSIGNHTFSHVNGWKTLTERYLHEVKLTDQIIQDTLGVKPTLFRPPYGKPNFMAVNKILKDHRIIMWDVLARDFDSSHSYNRCINNITHNTRGGSVIVLHDSIKCRDKMIKILPEILSFFLEKGIVMSTIQKEQGYQSLSAKAGKLALTG